MIDDGEFAGVPIGGLGTGSIGRTYRGDAARWHLEVGRHRLEPVAADGFSIFVGGPDGDAATVLSALRPTDLPAWGWDLPVGGGTYHGLFPRAWQTFEPDGLGVRARRRAALPVIARRPRPGARCLSGSSNGGWRTRARPVDGRAPAARGPIRPAAARTAAGPAARVVRASDVVGVASATRATAAPTALRGSLAIAALGGDGWS